MQLSLNSAFITKFESEKIKIGECLEMLQAKRLIALCALFAFLLNDEELAR